MHITPEEVMLYTLKLLWSDDRSLSELYLKEFATMDGTYDDYDFTYYYNSSDQSLRKICHAGLYIAIIITECEIICEGYGSTEKSDPKFSQKLLKLSLKLKRAANSEEILKIQKEIKNLQEKQDFYQINWYSDNDGYESIANYFIFPVFGSPIRRIDTKILEALPI